MIWWIIITHKIYVGENIIIKLTHNNINISNDGESYTKIKTQWVLCIPSPKNTLASSELIT